MFCQSKLSDCVKSNNLHFTLIIAYIPMHHTPVHHIVNMAFITCAKATRILFLIFEVSFSKKCFSRFFSVPFLCLTATGCHVFNDKLFSVSQGYPPSLQSDYQPIGGGMLNGGAVMSSSMDYHQLGRHTPNHHPSLDWSTDYHGNG